MYRNAKNRYGIASHSMKIGYSNFHFFDNAKLREAKCAVLDCKEVFKTRNRKRKYCLKHSIHRQYKYGIFKEKKK